MPYIERSERYHLDIPLRSIRGRLDNIGSLTYCFCVLGLGFVNKKGVRFVNFCLVIGALVCSVLEIYRRWVAPYEDGKINSNGDIK